MFCVSNICLILSSLTKLCNKEINILYIFFRITLSNCFTSIENSALISSFIFTWLVNSIRKYVCKTVSWKLDNHQNIDARNSYKNLCKWNNTIVKNYTLLFCRIVRQVTVARCSKAICWYEIFSKRLGKFYQRNVIAIWIQKMSSFFCIKCNVLRIRRMALSMQNAFSYRW